MQLVDVAPLVIFLILAVTIGHQLAIHLGVQQIGFLIYIIAPQVSHGILLAVLIVVQKTLLLSVPSKYLFKNIY